MATDSRWKRPWEDSHSSSYGGNHLSRGASSTASVLDSAPPPTPGLPSSAISITNPSFDSVSRQLPSLPQTIPAHSDSTILPGPDIRSPRTSASNLHDRPAERWESSFDGFQRKRRRVHDCLNEPEVAGFLGDLARDVSAPALDPLVRIERRSRDATFNFLPRGDECCSRLCVGPKCARVRILVQEIATELSLLDCGINETVSALTGVSQPSRDVSILPVNELHI
ncbi:hypothetical protein M501DRAFT_161798 [Patellaria atrata CBS 101060]|uniref:Uncharacterized protein n=1 Tax=Patellaria atrata CBS 101060 TaxID=1346257 RepID=A0A9P4SA59_9PEZI|nr:hypothetical protein M501DRAFT_161798 [Patellaria atrata CBS 101060]